MMFKFTIDKESLKENFYSEDLAPQRKWFFQIFREKIEKISKKDFMNFLKRSNKIFYSLTGFMLILLLMG